MARLSSIRRLAPEARELIATLRNNGQTIEQIRERLGQIGVSVSRSALGRYVRRLDAARPESIGEQLARVHNDLQEIKALLRGRDGNPGDEAV